MLNYLYSLNLSHDELDSVLVVRDYPNVFFEVTGLPLQREIKF